MELEIQTSDSIQAPWTTWFLYSAMGGGKTRSAATFRSPFFIIPANEGSELTLKQLTDRKVPFVRVGKRADGTVTKAMAHYSEILTELEKKHAAMRAFYGQAAEAGRAGKPEEEVALNAKAEAAFPWQTIVCESLTHLGDLLVDDVSNYGKTKMDQQGWGKISTFLRTVHSRLRNMEVHVVYTSLAKTQEAEGGGIVSGGPNLIGQMAEKLPSACDVVVYMEELAGAGDKGASVYRSFFRKYRHWQARTRFGNFPDFMDNFNFAELEKKIG